MRGVNLHMDFLFSGCYNQTELCKVNENPSDGGILMKTTLLLYDCPAPEDEFARLAERVFGPCKSAVLSSFNGDFSGYEYVVIVFFSAYGSLSNPTFFSHNRETLQSKRVALICISEKSEYAWTALKKAKQLLPGSAPLCLPLSEFELHKDICQTMLKLIDLKRKITDCADMPEELLKESILAVLRSHNTCTLCTAVGTHVRATPIEYMFDNGCLYFISEGGEKFANLYANPHVSVAIYNPYAGFDKLESLQMEGHAVLVEAFSPEYLQQMKAKGLDETKLRRLPVQLNMFKVVPERFEILHSAFSKQGFSAKQVAEYKAKELMTLVCAPVK